MVESFRRVGRRLDRIEERLEMAATRERRESYLFCYLSGFDITSGSNICELLYREASIYLGGR